MRGRLVLCERLAQVSGLFTSAAVCPALTVHRVLHKCYTARLHNQMGTIAFLVQTVRRLRLLTVAFAMAVPAPLVLGARYAVSCQWRRRALTPSQLS
eukprot:1917741-Rhodomonas_salina.1